MRHFTFNKIVNIVGAVIFLILGVLLIGGFGLSFRIVDEFKFFILAGGILSLLCAGICGFGFWKEVELASGRRCSVVSETIYILGLGTGQERPHLSPHVAIDMPSFDPLPSSTYFTAVHCTGKLSDFLGKVWPLLVLLLLVVIPLIIAVTAPAAEAQFRDLGYVVAQGPAAYTGHSQDNAQDNVEGVVLDSARYYCKQLVLQLGAEFQFIKCFD